MKNIKYLLGALALILMTSCEKEVVPPEEPLGPVIEILSPAASTSFDSGETLVLEARISMEGGLHEYLVTLTNMTTNEEVDSWSAHSHDEEINFREEMLLDIQDHYEWKLEVSASDHNGNTSQSSVLFYVNHG